MSWEKLTPELKPTYQTLDGEEPSLNQMSSTTGLTTSQQSNNDGLILPVYSDAIDQTGAQLSAAQRSKDHLDHHSNDDAPLTSHLTFGLVIAITQGLVGVFLFGYNTSLFNIPAETIQNNANHGGISDLMWGIVNAMFPAGAGIGAMTSGYFCDRFGRKWVFFVNGIIVIAGAAITAIAFDEWILMSGRLITGVTSGVAMTCSSMYLNEISPSAIRGAVGTLMQLLLTVAIMVSVALGKAWDSDPWWRIGCCVPAGIIAVHMLTFWSFPESPEWLVIHDRMDDAKAALIRLRGSHPKAMKDFAMLLRNHGKDEHSNGGANGSYVEPSAMSDSGLIETQTSLIPAANNDDDRSQFTLEGRDESKGTGQSLLAHSQSDLYIREWSLVNEDDLSFTECLKQSSLLRRVLMVSVGINLFQQLSGINVVFYYSGYLLGEAGVKGKWMGSVIISFFNVLGVMIVTPLVDKQGRRKLLLISAFGMFFSSVGVTICFYGIKKISSSAFGYPCIACLVAYVITFELGLGPITWMIIAEMTPAKHRGNVTSLAQLCNWSCNTLIALTSTALLETLGVYGFVPFGVVCLLAGFWILRYVPETSNQTVMAVLRTVHKTL